MPTVRVETNLEFGFFPSQFMTLFVYFLADLFGKDRQLMKYVFDTEKRMSMVSWKSTLEKQMQNNGFWVLSIFSNTLENF